MLNDIALLEDFDNPYWRRKKWKSPKEDTAKAFAKDAASFDAAVLERYVTVALGHLEQDRESSQRLARGLLLTALEMVGGPFELDSAGLVRVGTAGTLPESVSRWLAEEELAEIDGRLWFRDSVLRSLPDLEAIHEARGEHFYVRVLSSQARAAELLELMEQAYEQYAKHTGQEPLKETGLFVFPDKASYERYCEQAKLGGLAKALGFARRDEGLAITYEQDGLEQVCVHEGAHLFFRMAFSAHMPSWYDEGFASYFGQEGTMEIRRGKLETGRPLRQDRLASLLRGWIPLDELLQAEATDYAHDASHAGQVFYSQSWAFYTFLSTTRDRRFRDLFEKWESFCLGAANQESFRREAHALFDRLFAEVKPELETAVREWVEKQVK